VLIHAGRLPEKWLFLISTYRKFVMLLIVEGRNVRLLSKIISAVKPDMLPIESGRDVS
jgi:hypothetical protein